MSHANYTLCILHETLLHKQISQNQCDIIIDLKKAKLYIALFPGSCAWEQGRLSDTQLQTNTA